jgi:hypothetical protein
MNPFKEEKLREKPIVRSGELLNGVFHDSRNGAIWDKKWRKKRVTFLKLRMFLCEDFPFLVKMREKFGLENSASRG